MSSQYLNFFKNIAFIVLGLLFVDILMLSSHGFAEPSYRTKRKFSVQFGINSDPAPSLLSAGVGYNIFDFARINLGVGGYNNWLAVNGAPVLFNYSIRPLVYALAYAVVWMITAPLKNGPTKLQYDGFLEVPYNQSAVQSLYNYGGGVKWMVPTWNFTPYFSTHLSHLETQNAPFGISSAQINHFYYGVGFDYQSEKGFQLSVGKNFCPSLGNDVCGINLTLGAAF